MPASASSFGSRSCKVRKARSERVATRPPSLGKEFLNVAVA
jgi:hypothetical protein